MMFNMPKTPQTLLFVGSQGSKAKQEALDLAARLTGSALVESHPDIHIYSPEGKNSSHTIEDIRSCIEQISLPPFSAPMKVCIFEEAQQLSCICANALLKVCEEPPQDACIIFVSRDLAAMLPTLVARCRVYFFEDSSIPVFIEEKLLVRLLTTYHLEPDASLIYAEIEALQPKEDELYMFWVDTILEKILYWYRDLHIVYSELPVPVHYSSYKKELIQSLTTPLACLTRVFEALSLCRSGARRHIKLRLCLRAFFSTIKVLS